MSDCPCGAHYLQSCSWWCGLSEDQIAEEDKRRNPERYILKAIEEQNELLKKLIEEQRI